MGLTRTPPQAKVTPPFNIADHRIMSGRQMRPQEQRHISDTADSAPPWLDVIAVDLSAPFGIHSRLCSTACAASCARACARPRAAMLAEHIFLIPLEIDVSFTLVASLVRVLETCVGAPALVTGESETHANLVLALRVKATMSAMTTTRH